MAERWTILNQEQVIAKLPDNTYGPVVRITYRTSMGLVRSTDVPVVAYTADNVAAVINNEVDEIEAVQNL